MHFDLVFYSGALDRHWDQWKNFLSVLYINDIHWPACISSCKLQVSTQIKKNKQTLIFKYLDRSSASCSLPLYKRHLLLCEPTYSFKLSLCLFVLDSSNIQVRKQSYIGKTHHINSYASIVTPVVFWAILAKAMAASKRHFYN